MIDYSKAPKTLKDQVNTRGFRDKFDQIILTSKQVPQAHDVTNGDLYRTAAEERLGDPKRVYVLSDISLIEHPTEHTNGQVYFIECQIGYAKPLVPTKDQVRPFYLRLVPANTTTYKYRVTDIQYQPPRK